MKAGKLSGIQDAFETLSRRETCPSWNHTKESSSLSAWATSRLVSNRLEGIESQASVLSFARQGRILATASSSDGRVKVFDAACGTFLLHFDAGHRGRLKHLAWNRSEDVIYTVGCDGSAKAHMLRRDAATSLVDSKAIAVAPADSDCALLACQDGALLERDVRCRSTRVVVQGDAGCASIDASKDGWMVALGQQKGTVGILDRRKIGSWMEKRNGRRCDGPAHAVQMVRGDRMLVVDVVGFGTRVYEMGGGTLANCIGHLNELESVAQMAVLGEKEEFLAVGSRGGDIFVYQLDTGALVNLLQHPMHPQGENTPPQRIVQLHEEGEYDAERLQYMLRSTRARQTDVTGHQDHMPNKGGEPQVAGTGCTGMFAPAFASCDTNHSVALWYPSADAIPAEGMSRAKKTVRINRYLSDSQSNQCRCAGEGSNDQTSSWRIENCTLV